MKMRKTHDYYNATCCGCTTKVDEDIDPDKLYYSWLYGRCRAELEELPPRHQATLDRMKEKVKALAGRVETLTECQEILRAVLADNGINSDAIKSDYLKNRQPLQEIEYKRHGCVPLRDPNSYESREGMICNAPHQARAIASRPECGCSPLESGR